MLTIEQRQKLREKASSAHDTESSVWRSRVLELLDHIDEVGSSAAAVIEHQRSEIARMRGTHAFRGCRYEVHVSNSVGRWSRHHSIIEARKSYREAVNNRRGDHKNGAVVELRDVDGGGIQVLAQEAVHPWP